MRRPTPIEHGTMRGWRQHNRRKEPACTPCIDAKREDDKATPVGVSSAEQQAWNKGKTGGKTQAADVPTTDRCTDDTCGTDATLPQPAARMVRVHVVGSREPARWYCPGRCTAVGQALAEIRAIPVAVA